MFKFINYLLALILVFTGCNLNLTPVGGDTTESGNFICGGLTDNSDVPINEVDVKLYKYSENYKLIASTKTNKAGKYNFSVADSGTYQLRATYNNKTYYIEKSIKYNPEYGYDVGDKVLYQLEEVENSIIVKKR